MIMNHKSTNSPHAINELNDETGISPNIRNDLQKMSIFQDREDK